MSVVLVCLNEEVCSVAAGSQDMSRLSPVRHDRCRGRA